MRALQGEEKPADNRGPGRKAGATRKSFPAVENASRNSHTELGTIAAFGNSDAASKREKGR